MRYQTLPPLRGGAKQALPNIQTTLRHHPHPASRPMTSGHFTSWRADDRGYYTGVEYTHTEVGHFMGSPMCTPLAPLLPPAPFSRTISKVEATRCSDIRAATSGNATHRRGIIKLMREYTTCSRSVREPKAAGTEHGAHVHSQTEAEKHISTWFVTYARSTMLTITSAVNSDSVHIYNQMFKGDKNRHDVSWPSTIPDRAGNHQVMCICVYL